MAQLDPNLILGYKPIQLPDQSNLLMQAMQIQHMQQQGALTDIEVQSKQNALTRQAGLANTYKSFAPGMKLEDQADALTRAGYGAEGLSLRDKAAGINKDNAQTANYNAEAQQKTLQMKGGIATALSQKPDLNINDVGILKQTLQKQGIDTSDFDGIPPNASPDQLRQYFGRYGQGAMTSAQQMSQQLDQARLRETQQHDRATEATAQGQLGVAQGHLALSRQTAAQAQQAANQAVTYQKVTDAQGNETLVAVPTKIAPGAGVQATTVTNPDGSPLLKAPAGGKPLTAEQGKALQFGQRMQSAQSILSNLESQGVLSGGRLKESIAGLPGGTGVGNLVSSEAQQQYGQAKQNFILAALRDESGAAIGTPEYVNYEKAFFPQVNEPASVIAQKARERANIVATMGMKTGGRPLLDTASSASGKPARISGDADYAALPSGAEFIAPDGSHRRKP